LQNAVNSEVESLQQAIEYQSRIRTGSALSWRASMKLPSKTIVVIGVALIFGGAIIWHFVHAELIARRLMKVAADCRIRAEQGDAESQFRLGAMYFNGMGVPKDYAEAFHWYRQSAEKGYAKAEHNLGEMYLEGKGVPQDYVEAERWCRKAAEHGDPRAQDGLGFLYFRGKGVAQDYSEAAHWYRKSAEQGFANAQYDLGYLYYYGYGVPQDRVEASRLFHQAAAQGNDDARRAIGLNRVHMPAISKTILPGELLASFFFGVLFVKSGQSHRTRAQVAAGVVALLLILSFVLDLFWYSYIGHLQSSTSFTALYFVRQLVSGVIVAMAGTIVHARSAKVVLIASVTLFIGFVVYGVVHSELRHIPLTIRFFCFSGLFIGMFIPSAVFLWLDTKTTGRGLHGKGAAAAPVAAE
jgi:TPR repeat protein